MVRQKVKIRPLDQAQVTAAYPLARLLVPNLDLETWRRFVAQIAAASPAEERGILIAVGEGGYLCGLVVYRIGHDLRHGRVLNADHVIGIDIVDRGSVAGALLAALEELSESLGCEAVQTGIDAPQESLEAVWLDAGHSIEKTLLTKRAQGGGRVP